MPASARMCWWNWRVCARCGTRRWRRRPNWQDALRAKEAAQVFDADFIELARSVARHNGERIQVKNAINRLAGSRFIEEKQYQA